MKTVNTVISTCLVIIWIFLAACILSMLVQKYLTSEPEQYKIQQKPQTVVTTHLEKPIREVINTYDPTACCSVEAATINDRYSDISFTDDDLDLLAKIVYLEAGSVSIRCQQACAEVVLNRVVSDGFPSSIPDVIFEDGQFSTVPLLDQADPNSQQYEAIENALYGDDLITDPDVVYFSLIGENDNVFATIDKVVFCYAYVW